MGPFRAIDWVLRTMLPALCGALLILMVGFTIYTVVLRTVFLAPPFWGDTLTLFANIWLVLLAFALAVREREAIAMTAIDMLLPAAVARFLQRLWIVLFGAVGLLMLVYGGQVASRILGSYWELGNMPKSYPMMILPVSGALVLVATALALADHRRSPETSDDEADDAQGR